METKLGTKISPFIRAILYLCDFNGKKITVIEEGLFIDRGHALDVYANIPNPESQLVMGEDYKQLCDNLEQLHKNMENKEWLEELKESL